MTVQCEQQPVSHPQNQFTEIDYKVMGQAFDLHNEMGNLWEEKEYRRHLALKCSAIGLSVFEEVSISVSCNGFRRNYFIDLLINGIIYELKTVSEITDNHTAQLLNYLFLANSFHGKILNFGQDSLKWRFVSTSLAYNDRKSFFTDTSSWHPSAEKHLDIPKIAGALLREWGTHLSINLYKEALCWFLGITEENAQHRFVPLSTETLLYISGSSNRRSVLQYNLQKYLSRSLSRELLWINFNQNKVEFSSLHRSA